MKKLEIEAIERPLQAVVRLRRCPFCKCKPSHGKGSKHKRDYKYLDGSIEKAGSWSRKPYIGCRRCKFNCKFESVEEAITWWNGEAI